MNLGLFSLVIIILVVVIIKWCKFIEKYGK